MIGFRGNVKKHEVLSFAMKIITILILEVIPSLHIYLNMTDYKALEPLKRLQKALMKNLALYYSFKSN